MMASAKDIKGYCDFLFDELSELKEKVDSAIGQYSDFSVEGQSGLENLSSHLQDISNVIDEKMEIMGRSCGWKQFEGKRISESRSRTVHPEGVPYGETPM